MAVILNAQQQTSTLKKANLKVLLVGGYEHFLNKEKNNSFYLKYARVSGNFFINKKLSILTLINLADFKYDPKQRVLEIAALQWKPSSFFKMQVGQFRPFFGLEDMYPSDIMKSNSWSKQYSLMRLNNWESFQIGVAIYGDLKAKNIPFRYYYTLYNGNGKNKIQDDDNSKNHAFRLEYDLIPNLQIGANTAFTKIEQQTAMAHGVDILFSKKFSNGYEIALNSEYKIATNTNSFRSSKTINKQIQDFESIGFYAIPSIAKIINTERGDFVEFSCRYEYLQELKNGNTGHFYTPMISYATNKDYASKISLIASFSDYQYNIDNTLQYDSTILSVQYQFKF